MSKKRSSKAFSKSLTDGRKPKKRLREASPKLREIVPPVKQSVRGHEVTLRDLVREADAAGCTLNVYLDPLPAGSQERSGIAPGRFMQIMPVPGRENVFSGELTDGLRLEIMRNVEGELVFELTRDGKLMGTSKVSDHLMIQG